MALIMLISDANSSARKQFQIMSVNVYSVWLELSTEYEKWIGTVAQHEIEILNSSCCYYNLHQFKKEFENS